MTRIMISRSTYLACYRKPGPKVSCCGWEQGVYPTPEFPHCKVKPDLYTERQKGLICKELGVHLKDPSVSLAFAGTCMYGLPKQLTIVIPLDC